MNPKDRAKLIDATLEALYPPYDFPFPPDEARKVLEAFADKLLTCEVCGKTGLQGGEECVCGGPL
jgi:hypothetical protein